MNHLSCRVSSVSAGFAEDVLWDAEAAYSLEQRQPREGERISAKDLGAQRARDDDEGDPTRNKRQGGLANDECQLEPRSMSHRNRFQQLNRVKTWPFTAARGVPY